MRNRSIWIGALVVSIIVTAMVGVGVAQNIQSVTGKLRPVKLYKKGKHRTVSLFVDVSTTSPSNPNGIPSATTLAKVDFDKDIKIQNKGLDTCNYSLFTAATTATQAMNLCHSSLVGGGSSRIAILSGPSSPPLKINATVTAFNATHRRLVLFTYNTTSGGQTLIGTIRKNKAAGRQYGSTLTVPVPPLAGGSAVITEFKTRVKKAYRYKGRRLALVSATCRDKRIRFQARFTYADGTSDDARYTQKCRQIKPKHRH